MLHLLSEEELAEFRRLASERKSLWWSSRTVEELEAISEKCRQKALTWWSTCLPSEREEIGHLISEWWQSLSTEEKVRLVGRMQRSLLRFYESEEGLVTRQRIAEKLRGNKHLLGHRHTAETKEKMRLSHLGHSNGSHTEETRRKISEANTGYRHTEEAKEKMRVLRAQRVGFPHSEKTKEKLRKPKSEEAKERMRLAQRVRREREKRVKSLPRQ